MYQRIGKNESEKYRKLHLDMIRIIAIFLVLFTHTGDIGSKLYTVNNSHRSLYIFLDCLRTINNPLLFMVSGALLLGKEEPIKVLLRKRILRFIIMLFLFSYIHVIDSSIVSGSFDSFNVLNTFKSIIEGPVRASYWFLYSYIAFLIMLPMLRLIASSIRLKDGLYLFVVGTIVLDGFKLCRYWFGLSRINITIYFAEMILFYPILGYAIESNWEEIIGMIKRKYIFPLAIMFAIVGVALSTWMTLHQFELTGTWNETWITLFDPFVAIVFYTVLKQIGGGITPEKQPKLSRIITITSGSVFGIYLLENIFKRWTKPVFYTLDSFMPTIIACLLWLVVVLVVGTVFIWLIKKIPGVNKFL